MRDSRIQNLTSIHPPPPPRPQISCAADTAHTRGRARPARPELLRRGLAASRVCSRAGDPPNAPYALTRARADGRTDARARAHACTAPRPAVGRLLPIGGPSRPRHPRPGSLQARPRLRRLLRGRRGPRRARPARRPLCTARRGGREGGGRLCTSTGGRAVCVGRGHWGQRRELAAAAVAAWRGPGRLSAGAKGARRAGGPRPAGPRRGEEWGEGGGPEKGRGGGGS